MSLINTVDMESTNHFLFNRSNEGKNGANFLQNYFHINILSTVEELMVFLCYMPYLSLLYILTQNTRHKKQYGSVNLSTNLIFL